MPSPKKAEIIKDLQAEIIRRQGFRQGHHPGLDTGLGPIEAAFPNGVFPLEAIHEFISDGPTDTAATNGFMAGILSKVIGDQGTALWIGRKRNLFPAALRTFDLAPDRFLFARARREDDILWAMTEALKSHALSAVICEVHDFSFMASRRLQLAAEGSNAPGFVVRSRDKSLSPTAAVSRWKVTSLPSQQQEGLPGVGFPRWKVQLLKVRNGRTGAWQVEWKYDKFVVASDHMEGRTRTDLRVQVERRAG